MAEIYTRATRVEFWLGPSFRGSDEAMALIAKRKPGFGRRGPSVQEMGRHRSALEKILSAPYWWRVWIVQEILLGHKIVVRVGKKSVPWEDQFEQAWDRFSPAIDPSRFPKPDLSWGVVKPGFMTYADASYHLKDKGCTHLQDKVFGVLGLVSEPLRFPPDYAMTSEDLLFRLLRLEAGVQVHFPMQFVAQWWYHLLNTPESPVDPQRVRHFLIQEIYPTLRKNGRYVDREEPYLRIDGNKSGPLQKMKCWNWKFGRNSFVWYERVRLRWMFPDKSDGKSITHRLNCHIHERISELPTTLHDYTPVQGRNDRVTPGVERQSEWVSLSEAEFPENVRFRRVGDNQLIMEPA